MLPPRLASEICSLSPGEERFTVSVVFKVDLESGHVVDDEAWIGKAMIKSAGKLTYDDVDAVIGGKAEVDLQGATAKDIQTLKVGFLGGKRVTENQADIGTENCTEVSRNEIWIPDRRRAASALASSA